VPKVLISVFIFLKILEFEFTSILFPVEPNNIKELEIFVVTVPIFILLNPSIFNRIILSFSKIVVAVPIFNFSNDYIVILLVFVLPCVSV
jgi:hypothetical protein